MSKKIPVNLPALEQHCRELMWGCDNVIYDKTTKLYVKEAIEDARAYAEEAFRKIVHAIEIDKRGGE